MTVTDGNMHYTMTMDYSQFEKSIKSAISDVNIMQNAVLGLAQGMAALASVEGIKAFASKAFEMRSFFQDAEAAMKVFLKSEDLAAEHLKELQSYAWYNVFEFTDLVTASRQLQAFGTEVDDVIPIIDKLSNIAAATNTPLENLVGIFNKAKVAGRLDSKGLYSLGNMGVNVKETLKEMGEQADVTSLSFEQLEKVIDHLTDKDAGGMFAGLMDEQFNNLSSLKGALEDSLDTLFADFGEDLQPLFENILKDAQAFVAWLDEHRDTIEDVAKAIIYLVGAYGTYRGALALNTVYTKLATIGANTLGLNFEQLGKKSVFAAAKVGALTTASKVLNAALSTSVWTALIAAVAKLTIELFRHAKAQHAVADAANEATKDVIASVEKERIEFNELLDTMSLAEEGSEKYARALDRLKKKYPDYLQNLINEKGLIEDINAARKQGNELFDLEIAKKATAAKKEAAISKQTDAYADAMSNVNQALIDMGLNSVEAGQATRDLLASAPKLEYAWNKATDSFIFQTNWEKKDKDAFDKIIIDAINKAKPGTLEESPSYYSRAFVKIANQLAIYRNVYDQAEMVLDGLEGIEKAIEDGGKGSSNTSSAPFTANPQKIADDIEAKQKEINEIRRKSTEKRYQILDKDGNVIEEYEEAFVGLTDKEQEEIKKLEEEIKDKTSQYEKATGSKYTPKFETGLQRAKIAQQQAINAMSDGYSKTVAEINSKYDSEIKQLEHQVNEVLVPGTDEHESAAQELQLKKAQRGKELSDAWKSFQANKADAERLLDQMGTDEQRKVEDRQYAIDALTISLMAEGSQKEIAQMQLNHSRRMTELGREQADAIAQLVDTDKKEWEARQRAKGIDPNDGDFWAQYKGPNQEAVKAIQDYYAMLSKGQEDAFAKQQDDFWQQMLSKYGDYTTQKEAIDKRYFDEVAALEKRQMEAQIAGEGELAERLGNAIQEAKKAQAKETLDLDLATIDATAYATVEEKMEAINKAYETYIDNIIKAGASLEEQNAALREQHELTGKTATLSAKIQDLKGEALLAAERGDVDLVKRLNAEIAKLKKQLDNINKDSESKGFAQHLEEITTDEWIRSATAVADTLAGIAEASGNSDLADMLEGLGTMGEIGAKIAGGDYLGAALQAITSIGSVIAEDIALMHDFEEANDQAAVAAWQLRVAQMMDQEDGIFGDDAVKRVKGYVDAINELESGRRYNANARQTVLDRSGFANMFGANDQRMSVAEFARKNNLELYDEYGNMSVDVLNLFKETYTGMSDESKQWVDNAIAYSEQYAEAMENLADYLETLFGNTVDTIVDQLFEGAVDMEAIMSDVGKQMAKDLMKSLIMAAYFDDLKEEFQKIIQSEGGMTEGAMMAIYSLWSERMAQFNDQLPVWQELRDKWAETLDFDVDADSIGPGTALASASQESIDLMNGQLNALRTVQGRMESTINSILLEIGGFRRDMNSNHGETMQQLQQINSNTSTAGLGRSLGAYFG